jgi:D-sedoheptulose 7-phosphate isomerase
LSDSNEIILTQIDAHLETVRSFRKQLSTEVDTSAAALIACLERGGKILAFGNGGSAAQADHFVGELMGRFQYNRRPLPAVSLPASPSLVTCIANDFGYDDVFARQVEALAGPDDVAVGLTTSGQSKNVLRGLAVARDVGVGTIALTGGTGLSAAPADIEICIPSTSTARVQEIHLIIIHIWCNLIDSAFVKTATGP